MAKKSISWKTKGMNRDLSVSAFNPEFSYENINLRLSTNESNTMLSWVNERGPQEMKIKIDENGFNIDNSKIIGTALGTAILNHKLIIFTIDTQASASNNYIYAFQVSDSTEYDLDGKVLYNGNLGFNAKHPIETLVSYESESIQKVYWTDGINQPRVINVEGTKDTTLLTDTTFDFVPEVSLKEDITIKKIFGAGEFPAGVIQYAFTYFNKNGQESNIFYTTPLQYISYIDRGGSTDSKISNSFEIKVSEADSDHFDYLRIYSILRTSINGTPSVKRLQDIDLRTITEETATFIDDGTQGDTIDPTELLYKGGEQVTAKTIEQKDGTLFLGNISITRPPLKGIKEELLKKNEVSRNSPLANDNIKSQLIERSFTLASRKPFSYINTLSSPQGASGFKAREYYRLGVQFQYKNGKWSEPCWVGDKQQEKFPTVSQEDNGKVNIPEFKYTLASEEEKTLFKRLHDAGYRRIRPLLAVPRFSDRTILCQGVGSPTMYRKADRYANPSNINEGSKGEGRLYAQSSWLFRVPTSFADATASAYENGDAPNGGGKVSYMGALKSQYDTPLIYEGSSSSDTYLKVMSPYLRDTEIMGLYDFEHCFCIDDLFATIHTPEVIFDTSFNSMDFNGCKMQLVGGVQLERTYGDIDIQTSTPPIGSDAAGFVHKSIVTDGSAALISAPFYNDYLVDDVDSKYEAYNTSSPPVDYPVYMWHKNGSLNNDVARDNRSAEILKKKISNYRLGGATIYKSLQDCEDYDVEDIALFDSDTLAVTKVAGHVYMGNIETLLTPTTPSPYYIIGSPYRETVDTDFNTDSYYYLALESPDDTSSHSGLWHWQKKDNKWGFYSNNKNDSNVGDKVKGLCQWREPVSMKYKSTPHLAVKLKNDIIGGDILHSNGIFKADALGNVTNDTLPLVEIVKPYDANTMFGGTSDEALQAATWIPCGPVVSFDANTTEVEVEYKWGDTYFQRFECLKTYPFTPEDKNQVVEIASFMCETRVNIDGRYDRNRAQTSNLNVTPKNFNLLNPVYSQMDNFFTYKIMKEEYYDDTIYPNNVTWTKTKQNGADTDLWANITLANTLELDGDKGEITSLVRLNNQLLVFQDSGISQILYNENTQISTTEGVPIEIANSQKVQGKRYYSDIVGCSNKWSMAQTPSGIYFMDSKEKSIYLFDGQLSNLSTAGGFNSWAKQNLPSTEVWNPVGFGNFVTYYDRNNQEVLFIGKETALAYSEKFNCFTSFYDYGGAPYFANLDSIGIWFKDGKLWKHQAGNYCNFFGNRKPFSMTLIGNQEPTTDKIFTNLEFRACVESEGTHNSDNNKFVPLLPFDTVEVWNEYQHGKLNLTNRNSSDRLIHGAAEGVLARKFRIWRCDMPRDNAEVDIVTESKMGIRRFKVRPLDRIRNLWAYIKLEKKVPSEGNLKKTEIHDIMASYFA